MDDKGTRNSEPRATLDGLIGKQVYITHRYGGAQGTLRRSDPAQDEYTFFYIYVSQSFAVDGDERFSYSEVDVYPHDVREIRTEDIGDKYAAIIELR